MQKDINTYNQLVEKTIAKFNLDPVKTRVKPGEWILYSKEFPIWLYLAYSSTFSEYFFQVSAPIIHMPTENREAFCEQLIALNGELIGADFMEKNGTVYINTVSDTADLDISEAYIMIQRTTNYMLYYQDSQKHGLLNWTPYKSAGPFAPGPSSLT